MPWRGAAAPSSPVRLATKASRPGAAVRRSGTSEQFSVSLGTERDRRRGSSPRGHVTPCPGSASPPEQFNVLLRTTSPFSPPPSHSPHPILRGRADAPSPHAPLWARRRLACLTGCSHTHTLCGHAVGGCNPHDACGVHQPSEERPLGKPCLRESLAKFSSPELPHRLYSL